ncbi:MAG: viroplasmin family protein [Catenibacterium sp.]|uniref:ribonuclease H1 domain-containing protein n=1 Tax=Catenibacterium sp. TaxID=2049022 RepID=UPI0039945070
MKYYAVKNGRVPGIYNSWAECQKQIHGFKNASYKSFTSRTEAEEFISDKKRNTSNGTWVNCLCRWFF